MENNVDNTTIVCQLFWETVCTSIIYDSMPNTQCRMACFPSTFTDPWSKALGQEQLIAILLCLLTSRKQNNKTKPWDHFDARRPVGSSNILIQCMA